MSEYPLSTISSKKIKKSSNSLFEKSACQSTAPNLLSKQQYCHILKGERVFIELYYQGRVIQTAYNQWVEFMGGTLYKRLNFKVSIFLTNGDNQELQSILERVRRICPKCRVISILWFEKCFQAKSKVQFDEFELDNENKTKKEPKEPQLEEKIDLSILEGFLNNIAEDAQLSYKEFFKETKSPFFDYLPKNYAPSTNEYLMKAQDFDLGPNPNQKRLKTKQNPEKRKRRTSCRKIQKKNAITLERKEDKQKEQLQIEIKDRNEELFEQPCQSKEEEKNPPGYSLTNIMEKYLNFKQESESSQTLIDHELKASNKKMVYSGVKAQNHKEDQTQGISTVSNRTQLSLRPHQSMTKRLPLYSFSKNAAQPYHRNETTLLKLQNELKKFDEKIKGLKFNQIICVSDSKSLWAKIQQMNEKRKNSNEIELINISYPAYLQYLGQSPPHHKAYYLLNPSKIRDRPLYFALICVNPNHPSLVTYKLANEVERLNDLIRKGTIEVDEEHPPSLHTLIQIPFVVNRKVLRGKKVTFLQKSDLPFDVLQLIIGELEGICISQKQYLKGSQPDIVVTNRSGLPDPSVLTLDEIELWTRVFPLNQKERP